MSQNNTAVAISTNVVQLPTRPPAATELRLVASEPQSFYQRRGRPLPKLADAHGERYTRSELPSPVDPSEDTMRMRVLGAFRRSR